MARTRSIGILSVAAAWAAVLLVIMVLQAQASEGEQLRYAPADTVPFTLHFYSRNTIFSTSPTTKKIAPDTNQYGFGFGSFYVIDDNVTTTADGVSGATLGSLRGLVADCDITGGQLYFSLYVTFHLTFPDQGIDGTFVLGGASVGHPDDGGWEYPIIGGTRDFAWVSGTAIMLSNTMDSSSSEGLFIKDWNVTLNVNLQDPLLSKISGLQLSRLPAVADS